MELLYVNIIIACIWMALAQQPSPNDFIVGFVVGYFILLLFKNLFPESAYIRRTLSFGKFVLMFFRALILSSIEIAKSILFKSNESIHPNIITYDVSDLTPFEITLLTQCITLTPGTTSLQIEDDFKTIYVHAFDGDNPDEVRLSIEKDLKNHIIGFTR